MTSWRQQASRQGIKFTTGEPNELEAGETMPMVAGRRSSVRDLIGQVAVIEANSGGLSSETPRGTWRGQPGDRPATTRETPRGSELSTVEGVARMLQKKLRMKLLRPKKVPMYFLHTSFFFVCPSFNNEKHGIPNSADHPISCRQWCPSCTTRQAT